MSKKETTTSFTVNKIEVDTNTAEPVIVELNELEYAEELKKQEQVEKTQDKDAFDEKHVKQAVMTKVFGLNNSEDNISKRQKFFKRLVTIIFVVFVVAILAYTFYNDFFASVKDPAKQYASFGEILFVLNENWFYFLFALLSLCFLIFFKGFKLSILCKVLTRKFHLKTCVETGIIGAYYNNVTPLAVGGQPFEIYHLSKNGIHKGASSSLPIVAFFLNQVAFVILGILSISLLSHNKLNEFTQALPIIIVTLATIGVICCMFVPTLVIVFSLTPRICSNLVKFIINLGGKLRLIKNPKKTTFGVMKSVMHNARCIKKISTSPVGFILSILLSFCEQLANCSIAYFTLRFFGFDAPELGGFLEWMGIIQLCFILYAAISFIPTPGNSGAADISFYTLFSVGIKTVGLAFPALMVWRALSFYSIIVIGFVFLKHKKRKERKLEEANAPKMLF